MRKLLLIVLLLLSLLILVAGCASPPAKSGTDSQPPPADRDAPLRLTIGTAAAGTGLHLRAEAIAESIRRGIPGAVVNVETGSPVAHMKNFSSMTVDMAMPITTMAALASEGKQPFDRPYSNFSALMATVDQVMHPIVTAKTGLQSVDEIIEKQYPLRLAAGEFGSNAYLLNELLFDGYNRKLDDLAAWGGQVILKSGSSAQDLIKDGLADAEFPPAGVPYAGTIETARTVPLKLLKISPPVLKSIVEKRRLWEYTIPAGTYPFQNGDFLTFSDHGLLVVRADLPDDLVYRVTKAIIENIDYVKSADKTLAKLTPAFMVQTGAVSLHPGAEKYYREKGVIR